MRIELLKNVVLAVYNPRKSLILTGLMLIMIEYYFALVGYTIFWEHYGDGGSGCNSLFRCFLNTIDWTFKDGGAVGGILEDPNEQLGVVNIKRWLFDEFFLFFVVQIIVNMVAGIIIDRFGALKEETHSKE